MTKQNLWNMFKKKVQTIFQMLIIQPQIPHVVKLMIANLWIWNLIKISLWYT